MSCDAAVMSRIVSVYLVAVLWMGCAGVMLAQDADGEAALIRLLDGEVATVTAGAGHSGPASYALASEATVKSGPLPAGAPEAVTQSTALLGSSPNPSVFGALVTLRATVSPAAVTGTVTFYDGTAVLGVSTLAGGTATLQTSLLAADNRSLRAYTGVTLCTLPAPRPCQSRP